MLLRPKKCYIFKNIYLFLCLKVIFDTLGSFWLKNSSNFGKVQFCPELSNFSWFYPIVATREDFCTIVCQYFLKWVGTGTNERFYMCKLLCINIQYFLKEFDIFWHTVLMTFKQCWLIQNIWWQTRVKYPCK